MSASPSKRRRVELTLADRVNVIKESEAVPKPTLVPLDQGIIQAFKVLYRKNLTRSLLSVIDSAESAQDLCKKVTLLDCIGWITQSWKDIKTTTIERCFKKAGFCSCQADSEDTPENDDDDEEDDDVPLSVLVRQFALQADELVNIDNNLETEDTADNWEKQLLPAYKPAPSVDQDDSDVSDTEPDTDTLPGSDMSHREVLELATKLKNFATNKDSSFLEIAQKLQTMTEKEIVKQKCCERQSTITSFFVKQ